MFDRCVLRGPCGALLQAATEQKVAEFKLVLVGDGGVGKTTFVKRHLTGEFEKVYVGTFARAARRMPHHTTQRGFLLVDGVRRCWVSPWPLSSVAARV